MSRRTPFTAERIAGALGGLLVCKTILKVVGDWPAYFPPDFQAEFLLGRNDYFFGAYQWAFYAHIVSGPCTLILGLVLLQDGFRHRLPPWHRRLGRVQIAMILFIAMPSGLWMAWYAEGGMVAKLGFGTLAFATSGCAVLGWRAAMRRRFVEHRDWMLRCFALLCSAVVLRLIGGVAQVLSIEGTYPFAAWASWLLPLAALEIWRISRRSSWNPFSSSSP